MRGKSSTKLEKTKHTWSNKTLTLHCVNTVHGNKKYYDINLDFEEYDIQPDGILFQVLINSKCPLNLSNAKKFTSVLKRICVKNDIRNILSTKANLLDETKIANIYNAFEVDIDGREYTDKANMLNGAWRIFRDSNVKLSSGKNITDLSFSTILPGKNKADRALISENHESGIEDPALAAPLTLPVGKSADELESYALWHLQGRLKYIRTLLLQHISKILILISQIISCKNNFLPAEINLPDRQRINSGLTLCYRSYKKYSSVARLSVVCKLMEINKTHIVYKPIRVPLSGIELLDAVTYPKSTLRSYLLMSDNYLPWEALVSIGIVIGIETGYNPGTIFSLTSDRIKTNENGYVLLGLKSKSDQLYDHVIKTSYAYNQLSDTEKFAQYPSRFCIELLLKNLSKANTNLSIDETSLFLRIEPSLTGKISRKQIELKKLSHFCQGLGINPFTISQIRDQVSSVEYLSNEKNIYYVQQIMGHSNIATTQRYLETMLYRVLNELQMNQFNHVIEASILFASDHDQFEYETISKISSEDLVLFPVTDFSDEPETCSISQWLKSSGKIKIIVNLDFVEYISFQRSYYRKNVQDIWARNPERFINSHAPLIIICLALHTIILTSKFRKELARFDEKYL